MELRNGGLFVNKPGATFIADSTSPGDPVGTGQILLIDAVSGGMFDNQGTFEQSGPQTTIVETPFINSGTVDVSQGKLVFQSTGSFTQTAGTLRVTGGTLQSSTSLDILGGSIEGTGVIDADITSSGLLSPGLNPPLPRPGLVSFVVLALLFCCADKRRLAELNSD